MDRQILFVKGSRACVREESLTAARQLGLRPTTVAVQPPEQAIEQALRLHEQTSIGAVLGYEEDATLTVAHIAAALGLPAHPVAAAEAALDKPMMKQRFAAAGIPAADFIVAADEDEAVAWAEAGGYPVVVKPCRGSASQGVIRANDEHTLRQAYRRLRRIIRDHELDNGGRPPSAHLVERYLPGSELSCELLLQYGAPEVITEFGKPLPLTGPYFEESIYLTPPALGAALRREVHELSMAAAKALGFYHGPAHCEIRLTPDGPKVLEIAGRLLGGACAGSFRDRLGEDLDALLLRSALGERITLPAPADDAPTVGALMIPVPGEGRVVAVRGDDGARRVPGVRDVSLQTEPGEIVVPFPEQACYAVGFVSASGPDEAAVVGSLGQAAAQISLELTPLRPERWVRSIGAHDPNGERPSGRQAVLRTDPPPDEAIPLLARVLFDELPEPEALQAAERTLAETRQRPGKPYWMDVPAIGLLLGRISGPAGHVDTGGILPTARSSSTYESLVRALLDEFARLRIERCEIELDPRLTERADALAELGFSRQPELSLDPTWSISCALTESAG